MKITVKNYKDQVPKIDWKTINDPELEEIALSTINLIDFYSNSTIAEQVDQAIDIINKAISNVDKKGDCNDHKKNKPAGTSKPKSTRKPAGTSKPKRTKKPAGTSKPKRTKKPAVKKINDVVVSHYTNEYMLIRRFYNMVKKNEYTSFRRIELLYQAFSKSALERKVRKELVSPLYNTIYDKVTKVYDTAEPEKIDVNIALKNSSLLQQLKEFVESSTIDKSITFLKSFLRMQGKRPETNKVESLIKRIDRAIENDQIKNSNRLYEEVIQAKKELKEYLKNPNEKVDVIQYALSGPKKKIITVPNDKKVLCEIFGDETVPECKPHFDKNDNTIIEKKENQKSLSGIVSGNDLMNYQFESMQMDEGWEDLFQNPAKNLKIAAYGDPKNGKTSGLLAFSSYLARKHGNLLYVFADQGFCKSTQDLWKLQGLDKVPTAYPSDINTLEQLDKACATGIYDFIVIDMINFFIENENLKVIDFKTDFIQKYPDISFIYILESTKGGKFKGEKGWEHLPDAILTTKDFLMENTGRYGNGYYIVWEDEFKRRQPTKYAELTEPNNITI